MTMTVILAYMIAFEGFSIKQQKRDYRKIPMQAPPKISPPENKHPKSQTQMPFR